MQLYTHHQFSIEPTKLTISVLLALLLMLLVVIGGGYLVANHQMLALVLEWCWFSFLVVLLVSCLLV
jgi:hypothetical protein